MSKIKEFFANSKKKLIGLGTSAMMFAGAAVGTSAAEASAGVTEMNTAVSGALADLNVTNLASVIVAGLAIAVPLILAWFAFRWVFRKAKGALKSGK